MWSRQPGQLSVRAVLRHFAPYKGLVSLAGSALRSPPQARPPCAAAAASSPHFAAETVRLKTCVDECKAAWYTYAQLHDMYSKLGVQAKNFRQRIISLKAGKILRPPFGGGSHEDQNRFRTSIF